MDGLIFALWVEEGEGNRFSLVCDGGVRGKVRRR